jgi:transcriptional regulator GlxA family with amidase domain
MKTIGIYLYNNVEVLDFAGPFEVFSKAQRLHAVNSDNPYDRLFDIVTIAENRREIIASGGLEVTPLHGIEYHPHLDVLIVPGGIVEGEMNKQQVISWLRSTAERADITASVCTGAYLLARAGLLDGMEVTTHWEDIAELRQSFPKIVVKENLRWIDSGHVVTSAGISAGIDMSLHLVGRLAGKDHAAKTARQMEYNWQHN